MSEEPEATLTFELVEEGRALAIPASTEPLSLSPNAVTEMIRSLIRTRAKMQATNEPQLDPEMVAITHDTMRWAVEANATGGVTLGLLHPGTGWVAIRLDRAGTRRLLSALATSLQSASGRAG